MNFTLAKSQVSRSAGYRSLAFGDSPPHAAISIGFIWLVNLAG